MEKDIFYRTGECIYRLRWLIIILSLLGFICCIPILPNVIKQFTSTGFFDESSESAKANKILNKQLGYSYNRFIITYSSPTLSADNQKFTMEIKNSLSGLTYFPYPHHILYPDSNKQQISSDKHTAYAVILFKSNQEVGHDFLTKLDLFIKEPPSLTMKIGGEPVFLDDVTKQTQTDLNKAEYVGTPAAIIILLIIFGAVIAAVLPLCLGIYCAVLMLTLLYFFGHIFSLSIFTINIALLVGLCLSLDYALFFISRFQSQIALGERAKVALAITLKTAGKAIFFSGVAVFISLSALLFFPINILFSVGIGGLTAVFSALAVALIILPAVLGVLGKRINFLSIHLPIMKHTKYWQLFLTMVVKRAWLFFVLTLLVLITLSYPMINAKLGISDFRILPKQADSRQFYEIFKTAFGENELTPIVVIAKASHNSILSSNNIGHLYDYVHKIQDDPRVDHIESIVSFDHRLTKKQYQAFYQTSQYKMNPALQNFIDTNTTHDFTVITIVSKYHDDSPKTKNLITTIRNMKMDKGMALQVTGAPANTFDVLKGITRVFPYAAAWIIIFSYIVLLILLRSVILPLKAIVTTILSLTASFGVLVFIIQQGHFHQFLHFEPQGRLDISLCIIIICALFGFSMDYEVFLLARIKESYEATGDTIKSIILGIDQSSRIITSAAIIVILICVSFMFADILLVKAFGLGIAVAIFVDAFLIRMTLVPATMALLKKWNWYLPKWLDAVLPKMLFH